MEKLTDQRRIYWKSRRGMKELDLLLLPFVEKNYLQLSAAEQQLFAELLDVADPTLYSWLLGYSEPNSHAQQVLCAQIRTFHQH